MYSLQLYNIPCPPYYPPDYFFMFYNHLFYVICVCTLHRLCNKDFCIATYYMYFCLVYVCSILYTCHLYILCIEEIGIITYHYERLYTVVMVSACSSFELRRVVNWNIILMSYLKYPIRLHTEPRIKKRMITIYLE